MTMNVKKGSALLVVLGMVAFMVVSAVSFSIFMRQSRAPSSHLRRQVSARYLLRSALANAIARIDGQFASERKIGNPDLGNSTSSGYTEGVYDNTYPGLGVAGDTRRDGDQWTSGRVFTPFGPVDHSETVSTLTLEALAYLPPAIINEVRIDSRRTRTARWSNLSYELGRYAFTAVNVSDCFDINRLYATGRRTSAPGERINMGSLFETPALAEKFDSILEKSGDIPFVSIADFNIVAQGTEFSPFSRYIGSQQSYIYRMSDASSVSNALFITDTWFPESDELSEAVAGANQNQNSQQSQNRPAAERIDLSAGGESQPFREFGEKRTLMDFAGESLSPIRNKLQEYTSFIGTACLYDYLDSDSVPLSLCMPSVEAAPMIASINIANPLELEMGTEDRSGTEIVSEGSPGKPGERFVRKATQYKLSGLGGSIAVAGTALYPFLRMKDKKYPTNFKLEALVKIWWAPEEIRSRLAANSPVYPATKEKWETSVKDGVITVYAQSELRMNPTVKDLPSSDEDALFDFFGTIDMPEIDMPMMWYVEEWTERGESTERHNEKKYYSLNDCHTEKSFRPYTADGAVDPWWNSDETEMSQAFPTFEGGKWSSRDPAPHNVSGLPSSEYRMHAAIWIRVLNSDGDTVDMVPARPSDDSLWIGQGGGSDMDIFEDVMGGGSPVLEFCGTVPLDYTKETCESFLGEAKPEPFKWNSLVCVDPKYNWAPENWFSARETFESSSMKSSWLAKADGVIGADGRDSDFYMAVSDQEYLQSIGELAFIPYLGWGVGKKNRIVEYEGVFRGQPMSARNSWRDCACREYFWRTYSPFDDPIYDFDGEMEVVSGSNDFRVNPFTDDIRVMAAAIGNTPYDYYVASTNDDSQVNAFAGSDYAESLKHSFSKNCPIAEWDDEVVREIAMSMSRVFRDKGRQKTGADWTEIYDDLDWFDGGKGSEQLSFFGVELDDPLYGVDRKFLYSYWRECFQNKQQLFLVFVRAEPLSVGGASGDAVGNAQLGARGVALVWRDPAKPEGNNRPGRNSLTSPQAWQTRSAEDSIRPHRTRVLFYHQFD